MKTKGMDALAAAKADPNGTAATLEAVGRDMMETAPDNIVAQARFVEVVVANPRLIAQLFDDTTIRKAAREWFATFARDAAKAVGAAGGDVPEGQRQAAAPEQISDAGAEGALPHGQPSRAPAVAEPDRSVRGLIRDAQSGHVRVVADGANPKPGEGAKQPLPQGQYVDAPSSRPQSITDVRAAAKAAQHIARTVFDSFKVRDGRAIGDVTFGEIERLRASNSQEAAVLRQIQRHIQASPETRIRDAVKESDLERFIQRGAEVADAA